MESVYIFLIAYLVAFIAGCGYLGMWWKNRKVPVESEEDGTENPSAVVVRNKWYRLELPWAVVAVFFINSFVMSFKINFFGAFINEQVPMSTSVFTQYFAFTYIPFSFKPLYAYIFENFSIFGSKRKAYVIVCNLCICVTMILMATVVKEVWQVFLVGFLESFFEAAAGMVVGLVVIDVASEDTTRIPKLQSEQTVARYGGTFFAYLIALPVSGCFNHQWSNRTALLFSGFLPLLGVVAALFIPETKSKTCRRHGSDYSVVDSTNKDTRQEPAETTQSAESNGALESTALLLFVPTIVLFELLAFAIGIKANLQGWNRLGLWKIIVASCGGVLLVWILGAAIGLNRWGDKKGAKMLVKIAIPCVYLFIVDAIPTTTDPFSSYKYSVLTDRCEQQLLSIIGTLAQIVGIYLYGLIFTGMKVEFIIVATTLLTATVGLSDLFKLNPSHWKLTLFQIWMLVDAFSGIFSPMFLLSKEVIAAHYSFSLQRKRTQVDSESGLSVKKSRGFSPGILYSIYLTCFDIGGSASGFLSATIVLDLGITTTDFHNLSSMVLLCGSLFIATLVLVPLLQFSKKS